jgi:hypothetical protein
LPPIVHATAHGGDTTTAYISSGTIIRRVREENVVAYFKGIISLLPKDLSLEGHLTDERTGFGSLTATQAFIEQVIRESEEAEKEKGDEPKH